MVQPSLVASFVRIQVMTAAIGSSVLHDSRFVIFCASEEDRTRRYIKEYKEKLVTVCDQLRWEAAGRFVVVADRPGNNMRGVDCGVDQGANSSTTIAGPSK